MTLRAACFTSAAYYAAFSPIPLSRTAVAEKSMAEETKDGEAPMTSTGRMLGLLSPATALRVARERAWAAMRPVLQEGVLKRWDNHDGTRQRFWVMEDDRDVSGPFGSFDPAAQGIPVPFNAIQQDINIMQTGRRVIYTLIQTRSGPRAVDVNLVEIPEGLLRWLNGERGRTYGGLLGDQGDMRVPNAFKLLVVKGINAYQAIFNRVLWPYARQGETVAVQLYFDEPGTGRALLWCKVQEKSCNLRQAVFEPRKLVCDVLYSLIESGVNPLLGGDPRRLRKLTSLVKCLSRGSKSGPDSPLQHAGHLRLNGSRITCVTGRSQLEVIENVGSILELLFEGRDVPDGVSVRAIKFAFRAALDAPSIDPLKIKYTKQGEPDQKQQHTNPSDVFESLLAAWHALPIESEDLKEVMLSFMVGGLNHAGADVLPSIVSYIPG